MAKKKQSKFKGKVNRNVETQVQASSSYGYLNLPKGVNMFKPLPGGRALLDFMPYIVSDKKHMDRDEEYDIAIVGEPWYKKPFKIHKNVGPDEETVICPKTFGKPCPICEHRSQLAKEGETDKEILKDMGAKDRVLYCVIPLSAKDADGKAYEEKPHIFDMSWWLFQDLLNDELEENEDNEVFPDLEEGKSLKIRWDSKKMGKGPAYADASRIDFEERDEEYNEEIMDDIPDLDNVLKILSYKELEKIFFDIDPDEEDTPETKDFEEVKDDDEKSDRKKKSTHKKKKKEKDVDEDPEEKPKHKKPSRKKKDVDEEPEEKKVKDKEKSGGKGKCPHGHKFGVDGDDKKECNSCDDWDDCMDAKEKKE